MHQGAPADQDHHGLDTGLPSRAAAGLDPGPGWLGEAPNPTQSPTPLGPLGLPEPTTVVPPSPFSDHQMYSVMRFLTCLINPTIHMAPTDLSMTLDLLVTSDLTSAFCPPWCLYFLRNPSSAMITLWPPTL